MSDWKATPELRFVKRDISRIREYKNRILQQKWIQAEWDCSEWRDVPLVDEKSEETDHE